jgi:hypothetical protein
MAVLAAIAFSFSVHIPKRHGGGFKSDESSYVSITQSLAYDQDLRYELRDLQRIFSRFVSGPMGVFLKKKDDGRIFFAKSFAYPLWAAPFFRFFDMNGLLLFNALMLVASTLMAYLMLRLGNPMPISLGLSIIFSAATVVPVYLWWMTADLFNYFVCFAGLFFLFYPFKRPWWIALSGFFFAFAIFSKPSSALPLGIIALLLLFRKEYKRFTILCLGGLITLSALVAFNITQTGDYNFMAGNRRSFHFEYPLQKPQITFENAQHSVKMSADDYWERHYLSFRLVAANLFYFFFGRFSGLFIYFFMAVLALILFFFRKKGAQEWFLFAAIASAIFFFITITPNYFGGSGSVGNRYFMTIYPIFFFLLYPIRLKAKHLMVPSVAGILFVLPILMDSMYLSATPRLSAISGFARFFPPEKPLYPFLPTNENYRAFGRIYGESPDRFQVYFINDNFRIAEGGNRFWTMPNPQHRLEAFLVTDRMVKTWQMDLKNIPLDNQIRVRLDDYKTVLTLPALAQHSLTISPRVSPLQVGDRYVYQLTVSCSEDFIPYLADITSEDLSHRGIEVSITIKE